MYKCIYLVIAIVLISGCSHIGQSGDATLLDTKWNLVELFTEKIEYSGSTLPHLRFEAERVSGNNGCNNFSGGYTLEDNNLKFGVLASTRMACPHIEGFEMIFNTMLSLVTRYRITGNRLDLFDDEKLLASFAADGGNQETDAR